MRLFVERKPVAILNFKKDRCKHKHDINVWCHLNSFIYAVLSNFLVNKSSSFLKNVVILQLKSHILFHQRKTIPSILLKCRPSF